MLTKQSHNLSSKRTSIPRRSFLDGMASALDIGARYHRHLDYRSRINISKKKHLNSDIDAIRSDWAKIGLDIYNVTCEYGEELSQNV